MREYDKMSLKVAERVFEKGDEILEQRQKKAAKIRHISYAVSGLCAVLIVCFGVWKILPSMKKPDNSFNGSNIVITTENPTASETTAAVTTEITTAEKTEKAVTTVKTTAKSTETAAAVTVRTSANAAAPAGTTAVINTVTRRTTAKATAKITLTTVYTNTTGNQSAASTTAWSGEEIAHMTTSGVSEIIEAATTVTTTFAGQEGSPVTISRTTERVAPVSTTNSHGQTGNTHITGEDVVIRPVTTTTSVDIYSDIRVAFKTYPVSVSLDNIRYDMEITESYPPSSGIGSDEIGSFIRKARVTIYITKKNKIVQTMEVYEVSGRSVEQAVAVRLTDTDEYYLFRNFDYKKEDNGS